MAISKISGAPIPASVAQKIPVDALRLDHEGMVAKTWYCYLPEGITLADARETPEVWSLVQKSPNAIHRGDHLYIYSFGCTELCDTFCCSASDKSISLAAARILNMGNSGVVSTFNDGKFKTQFSTGWWDVVKIAGERVVSTGHATEALAIAYIQSSYPRRA